MDSNSYQYRQKYVEIRVEWNPTTRQQEYVEFDIHLDKELVRRKATEEEIVAYDIS